MTLLLSAVLCMSIPMIVTGVLLIVEGRGYCEAQIMPGSMLLLGGLAATTLAIINLALL